MDGLSYLALEYLTYLLLAFAAGVVLFVCAMIVMAGEELERLVTETWETVVGPRLHDAWQHLPSHHAALVTAHSAQATSFARRKRE